LSQAAVLEVVLVPLGHRQAAAAPAVIVLEHLV
jgi:hypothetical protein